MAEINLTESAELPKTTVFGRIGKFVLRNAVLFIALIAALISCFFIPFDKEYLNYFDFKTLTCLFCMLAVICAFRNIKFFQKTASVVIKLCGNLRLAVMALVGITFVGSIFIANDMALITFLPLGFFVLKATNNEKHMAFTFVMQNIAANLGGMIVPFGNPQSLYLFSYFNIPTLEFMGIMVVPFILSFIGILGVCFFVPSKKLTCQQIELPPLKLWRVCYYSALFILSILIVFGVIPFYIGLIVIVAALLIVDYKSVLSVDYPLLLTFCAFFVFSGNLSRIPALNAFLSGLLEKNVLLVGVLSCQFISNVPSAILLSKFTLLYAPLLVAVNIGGVGTLISSLASLITYREYCKNNPGKKLKYLGFFSLVNFAFLAALTGVAYLMFYVF